MPTTTQITWKIVDAKNMILGRMLTQVAKSALLGEHIVIINCQDTVISGRRNSILNWYLHLQEIGDAANPTRSPHHLHRPDTFVRQRTHFMMPKNFRGIEALKRVHTYISSIPSEKTHLYTKTEPFKLKACSADRLQHHFITIGDLCDNVGWTRVRGVQVK
jgi:ribosomal protein uL13